MTNRFQTSLSKYQNHVAPLQPGDDDGAGGPLPLAWGLPCYPQSRQRFRFRGNASAAAPGAASAAAAAAVAAGVSHRLEEAWQGGAD
jgi:hypothetical protein